jgi:hypothetical protein
MKGSLVSWTVFPRMLRGILLSLLAVCAGFGAATSVAQAAPALTFDSFSAGAFNADGTPATQAGSHPYELTTSFEFGTVFSSLSGLDVPDAPLKNTVVEIPPGVIGDPSVVPQCVESTVEFVTDNCPSDTQVGYADVDVTFFGRSVKRVPVYNVVPPAGEPAEFRFAVAVSVIHVGMQIRSDGDYGVTASARGANAGALLYGVSLHLWGVPMDPSHDADRFPTTSHFPGASSGLPRRPFLRNPTSCTGPTTTAIHATSWSEPEAIVTALSEAPATTGCASLPFAPTLSLTPDTKAAGAPAGLGIDLDLPQNENPDGLATADLRRAVVRLPSGVSINPGAGDGLEACSDAQFGLHSSQPESCPDASTLGTMQITTPLLPKPLQGSIYLAAPHEQGPAAAAAGQMFRIFLGAHGSGTEVKLAGSVVPDPVTGQLVATFDNNPQLPFTNVHMQFTGGSRAPLALPKACGTYITHSVFTSWATENPVSSDSAFTIDQNCDQAGRFEPSLQAGVMSPFAGASSPFTMTFSRPDGQQDVSSLELTLPPGLTGKLAGIPLCPAAQAATGTCSSESQIGKVTAGAGAGLNPLWVPQPGKTPTAVYLSGPYKGAPFSLSVVVPAQAGPFDLGTVVVRAALYVDRNDAHVSVISDPFPTILDGVPLNVQKINVTLDRPGFMLAPTNCTPMQISGTATSSAGATAPLASRFQVGSCASLKFAPKFSVSTVGASTKANGASLTAKLSFPTNQGTQANITKVKVELPKQLPSRLTTLQKACTSAQFEANPAGCPPASFIGHATVHTPLLPVPLTGPAIFVSHGGEAFPSLVMVLQGYGVTVNLVGMTFISKAGITSTTFKTVPDVPFNDFELTLPQGKFSALAANLPAKAKGSFCGQKLVMPSEFIAQNGAVLRQGTPVTPTGCAKKASLSRAQKLALALKACKRKAKGKRAGCARVARRQFGVVAKRARGRG